jgi:hypothetical protein
MTRLANFSVEDDNNVLLKFLDGTHIRVHPADVSRHLKGEDLAKVNRALKLRKHFIDKILPPGAAVLLLGVVIALGSYDVHRLAELRRQPAAAGSSAVGGHSSSAPAATSTSSAVSAKAKIPAQAPVTTPAAPAAAQSHSHPSPDSSASSTGLLNQSIKVTANELKKLLGK